MIVANTQQPRLDSTSYSRWLIINTMESQMKKRSNDISNLKENKYGFFSNIDMVSN